MSWYLGMSGRGITIDSSGQSVLPGDFCRVCHESDGEERGLTLWAVGGIPQTSLSKAIVLLGLPPVFELLSRASAVLGFPSMLDLSEMP